MTRQIIVCGFKEYKIQNTGYRVHAFTDEGYTSSRNLYALRVPIERLQSKQIGIRLSSSVCPPRDLAMMCPHSNESLVISVVRQISQIPFAHFFQTFFFSDLVIGRSSYGFAGSCILCSCSRHLLKYSLLGSWCFLSQSVLYSFTDPSLAKNCM